MQRLQYAVASRRPIPGRAVDVQRQRQLQTHSVDLLAGLGVRVGPLSQITAQRAAPALAGPQAHRHHRLRVGFRPPGRIGDPRTDSGLLQRAGHRVFHLLQPVHTAASFS